MAVLTPFFDVVAGVTILAGRSSLLDTGIFKTANTNFTIRHLLALGFIGYGGWNLWKIEKAQDKLKKSLGAEQVPDWYYDSISIYDEDADEFYGIKDIRISSDDDDVSDVIGADSIYLVRNNGSYTDSSKTYEDIINFKDFYNIHAFGTETMLVQSDGIMVELMGFDGSYRSDGEVKVGYTTAAELGFEPKQLKPVMWVWDDIEGYGAFMATEDIRFV